MSINDSGGHHQNNGDGEIEIEQISNPKDTSITVIAPETAHGDMPEGESNTIESMDKQKEQKMDDVVHHAIPERVRNPRCDGTYEDLPEWQKDNEYMKTGYRIDYEGTCEVASTACKCHNETVNVWTHIIGSVLMAILAIVILGKYENIKAVAHEGWKQYLDEQSKDSTLELSDYIESQFDKFDADYEIWKRDSGPLKVIQNLHKDNEKQAYLVTKLAQ